MVLDMWEKNKQYALQKFWSAYNFLYKKVIDNFVTKMLLFFCCESGSMVEHCLPKATVASSNLVFRSNNKWQTSNRCHSNGAPENFNFWGAKKQIKQEILRKQNGGEDFVS